MHSIKAILLATAIFWSWAAYAEAPDVTISFIEKAKLRLESLKKENPSIAEPFQLSAKNDFKDEIGLATQFYDSLALDQQNAGFKLLHDESKEGVSLKRYTTKVRQAYQFFGKPGKDKKIVYFGIGYQTRWLFYKVPTATVTFNTKLLSKDKKHKLNGFVKIILTKDGKGKPAKVMSFVIVPGKINTPMK